MRQSVVVRDDPESWDDLTLARRCAGREEAAWREFLRRIGPEAQAMMRRLFARGGLPDPDREASEALGELAAHLLAGNARLLRAYRPVAPLRTFVAAIARNVAVDILRKRSPGFSLEQAYQGGGSLGDLLAAPAEAAPDSRSFEAALASLPARDRLILRLFYWEGASYAEIAGVLGVAPGSLGPLMVRARDALRRKLPEKA